MLSKLLKLFTSQAPEMPTLPSTSNIEITDWELVSPSKKKEEEEEEEEGFEVYHDALEHHPAAASSSSSVELPKLREWHRPPPPEPFSSSSSSSSSSSNHRSRPTRPTHISRPTCAPIWWCRPIREIAEEEEDESACLSRQLQNLNKVHRHGSLPATNTLRQWLGMAKTRRDPRPGPMDLEDYEVTEEEEEMVVVVDEWEVVMRW